MQTTRTIKEIAAELGTNKNVIYRIIKKLDLEPSTREHSANACEHSRTPKANSAKYYDADAINAIIAEYSRMYPDDKQKKNEHPANAREHLESTRERSRTPEPNTELIEALRSQIEQLKAENERQNETIKHHEQTIESLMRSLEAAQDISKAQLVIAAAKKPKLLERIAAKFKKNQNESSAVE